MFNAFGFSAPLTEEGGAQERSYRSVSGDTTVTADDYYVGVSDTSAKRTITLPPPDGRNALYVIKDESGAASQQPICVKGGSIDGLGVYAIQRDYGYVALVSDGQNWHVTSQDAGEQARPVARTGIVYQNQDSFDLKTADLDGQNQALFFDSGSQGITESFSIAPNPGDGWVYVKQQRESPASVFRVNLDTAAYEVLNGDVRRFAFQFDVDPAADVMIYCGQNGGPLYRSSIDPNGDGEVVIENGPWACGTIAPDEEAIIVSVCNGGDGTMTVRRVGYDGTEEAMFTDDNFPSYKVSSLGYDPFAGYLFVFTVDHIYRYNLDGSDRQQLIAVNKLSIDYDQLRLDIKARRVLFSTSNYGLSSCDYDGGNAATLIVGAEDVNNNGFALI